ncbi:MAG TPA: MmcQ/YjbR family DNA-binding protein [Gemmatimonadaceae bacterium]|nr:MmcQ/YjbR family DNA-binding protein [Gemmatimonadaceae bacterium]
MARSHLARIRKLCLSLPEATEVEAWGEPTFRVGKIFVMYAAADTHHGSGREGIWIKSSHFTQDLLVRGQPSRYFSPPYVGPQGWTGAWLDAGTDWIAVTELIRDAYRSTAPRRLAALVPEDDAPTATTRPRAAAKGKGLAVKKRPPAAKKAPKRGGSKKAAAKKRR